MNKALKRKVKNISMPVEIDRNEWLMLFCIHLAIFKSTALFQKSVSRSERYTKEQRLIGIAAWLWVFLCACWADCTQAAILHLSCRQFTGTWELCGEGSTNTGSFFHASCPSLTLQWAAKHQIHSRATVLLLCLSCLGGYVAYVCGDLTLRQTVFTLRYRKSSNI